MWGGGYGRLTPVNGLLVYNVSLKYFAFIYIYLPIIFIFKHLMYLKKTLSI